MNTICYLQGGPCDLQKLVLPGAVRPEVYMAFMDQPLLLEGKRPDDLARQVNVKKLIYKAVGGYSVQSANVAIYAYAGLLPDIEVPPERSIML